MKSKALTLSAWFINNNFDVSNPSFDGNVKLQKLLYYSKAMFYAVYDESLFSNRIEAWENGPVVSEVFAQYRHHNLVGEVKSGFTTDLDERTERVLKVINHIYGSKTASELITLSHEEEPWKDLEHQVNLRLNPQISEDKIKTYYKPLKDIYDSLDDEEIENTVFDRINGNTFSYDKTETSLTDEDLEVLSKYGENVENHSYFVYKDGEELVVY